MIRYYRKLVSSIFSANVLALCALEEFGFCLVCCPHLACPEISFFISAFWANFCNRWHDICFLVLDNHCFFHFIQIFCAFKLDFSFCNIVAFQAAKIFPLFNKNTSAFRAKFHYKLCLLLVFKCFLALLLCLRARKN